MPRYIGDYSWDLADAPEETDQNSGVLGDTGTDLKLGVGQLKQASYAVGDLVARPFRSDDDETFSERLAKADENEIGSEAWQAKKRAEYSDARQASEEDYEAVKKSFGDSALGQYAGTIYSMATHPRVAFGRIAESAPAMVAGGGVGGAIAKGATALGLATRAATIARAANIGAALGEGVQSGANNAYDLMNYNVRNGRPRYEGMGGNQLLTAGGVAMTSLVGARVGGGIEASLFNKEARQALKAGNKGTVRAAGGEFVEETGQTVWEDVPQNLSMGKSWDEGLYEDMAESGFAGGAMGGGVHIGHRVLGTTGQQSLLNDAPTQQDTQERAQARAQEQMRAEPQGEATQEAPASEPEQTGPVYALGYDPRVGTRNDEPIDMGYDRSAYPAPSAPVSGEMTNRMVPQWMLDEHGQRKYSQSEMDRMERQRQQGVVPPVYALGYDPRVGTRNEQPIIMGHNPNTEARYNHMTPQSGFDERGHRTMSNQELNDYHSGNRRAVEDAAAATPMAGTQPVPPAPQRELTKEEKAAEKARQKAEEKKAKEKAAFQQAEAEADTYHSHYADTLERGKKVSRGEMKEDAQWHEAHPEMAPTLQVLARANKLAKAGLRPSELRDLARKHHSENPISMLESLERGANDASTVERGDVLSAAAEILRNPEADLEQFIAGRQKTRADAEAKAVLEAETKKAQKKAEKAEAAKPKAEPVEEVVPSAEEWEKMSDERRAKVVTAAARSKNKEFHDGVRDLNDKFRAYQEKVRQNEEGKKAATEKAAENEPAKTEPKKEEPTAEEKKEAPAKLEEKKEEPKAEEKKDEIVTDKAGRRVWKSVLDEEAERPEGYPNEMPAQYLRRQRWLDVVGRAMKALFVGHDEVGARGGVTHVRGVLKANSTGFNRVGDLVYAMENGGLKEDIQRFATKEHLKALEAIESVTRELYYPDFDLGLDELRAKLGVKKAAPEAKAVSKETSESKAKEVKPEAKEDPKPTSEAMDAFLQTTKKLVLPLKACGILDGKVTSLGLPDIKSETFRKRASEVRTMSGLRALTALRNAAKKIAPGYELDLPSAYEVEGREMRDMEDNAGKVTVASGESSKAKKTAAILKYLREHPTRLKGIKNSNGVNVRTPSLSTNEAIITLTKWLYSEEGAQHLSLLEKDIADEKLRGEMESWTEAGEGEWSPEDNGFTSNAHSVFGGEPKSSDDGSEHPVGDDDLKKDKPNTRNAVAAGKAGAGLIASVKAAYKASRKQLGREVFDMQMADPRSGALAMERIETPELIAQLDKKLKASNKANLSDNIAQAMQAYSELILGKTDGHPGALRFEEYEEAEAREAMENSPVGRWLARQAKLVDSKLLAKVGKEAEVEDRQVNAFIAKKGSNPAVAGVRSESHPEFRGIGAKISAAVHTFLANTLMNDGGWCEGVDMDAHVAKLRKKPRTKAGKAIFAKSGVFKNKHLEGIVIPLAYAMRTSKNLRSDLATIVSKQCADNIMHMIDAWAAEGKSIPDNLVVLDLGIQNSEHVSPDALDATNGQFSYNRFGFHVTDKGEVTNLATGAVTTETYHVCAIAPTERNPHMGASQRRASDNANALVCSHEALHDEDERTSNKLGRWLFVNLSNHPEAKLLRAVSFIGVRGDIHTAQEAMNFLIDEGKTWYHGVEVDAAKLWAKMSVAEREAVARTFAYPWVEADQRGTELITEGRLTPAEIRTKKLEKTAAEMYAAWGSAYMSRRGPGRAVVDKYFPECAKQISKALSLGTKATNKQGAATPVKSNTQGPATPAKQRVVNNARADEPGISGYDGGRGDRVHEDASGASGEEYLGRLGEGRERASEFESERGRDDQRSGRGSEAPQGKETPEEREARVAREKAAEREARVQKAIKEDVLLDPAVARTQGIDPDAYETPEGKAVVRGYAEAIVDERSARSRVGALSNAAKKDKSKEEALAKAQSELHETKAKVTSARVKFSQFTRAHQKEVHYEPLKPQASEQFPYDKWVNKIRNPKLQGMARNVASALYKHGLGFTFTRDLVNIVKGYLPAATRWQNCMDLADQEGRTWQARAVAINQKYDKLTDKGKELLNRLMESSAIDGIWYALPENADQDIKDIFKAQWHAYEDEAEDKWHDTRIEDDIPADVMEVYKDALNWGRDAHQAELEGAVNQVVELYRKSIEAYPDKMAELEAERNAEIKRVTESLKETTRPYFPIRRFGDYVVVVRSEKYNQLWQQFTAVQNAVKGLDNPNTATRHTLRDLRTQILQLQQNGEDYVVEFAESPADAVRLQKELQEALPNTQAVYKERMQFMQKDALELSSLLNVAHKAAQAANPGDGDISILNEKAAKMFSEYATQMYIQHLSNKSAMKSRLHRRKVAGYSKDMMRAFMTSVSAQARHLGFLKQGEAIRDSVDEMIQQARTSENQAVATTALNEILQRIDQSVQGVSPATNAALRTTSAWMLLTNPSFFLQNLTQPLLYSVPYIAPRYGMYQSLGAMSKEMVKVAAWVRKDGTLSDVEYLGLTEEETERLKELESQDLVTTKDKLEIEALRKKLALSPDQVKLLQTMQTRGLLDIGLSQEFGEYSTAEHGEISNKVLGWTNFLAKAARQVEIVNRASTALVSYNLEKARLVGKGMSEEEAQAKALTYADHVLYETHGDYSSRNAPRYFKLNTLTRLASQFRKFQLIQLGWMCRMIKQSLSSVPSEERAFARAGLLYTMSTFALVTGVRGMPLVGTAMLLMGLGGGAGDDDEDVVRRELVNAGVDKAVVDFMLRGLPAAVGLDLSEKLGARNMLLPTPYYDGSYALKGGEDDAKDLLASVLGPAASLFLKFGRAADYAWQGDTYKGVETAMPTGIANVMKAVRFSTEGISSKGGDILVPGENFSFADLVTQAIGLPTTEITNRSLRASSMYRHQTAYQEVAKGIRRDYQKAVKVGDRAGVRKALEAWQRMNQDRMMQGFAPNKVSNLTGAVKAQRKRERDAIGGVAADKSNRGFAANLAKMY